MNPPAEAQPRYRIVIADDDPLSRRFLVRALENNYEAVSCHGGHEAVRLLESDGAALVVLDYEMPDLNGAQVCKIIRSSKNTAVAQSPIIMLTAHSNAEHEIECLRSGANDFVTKPVNTAILRARIETQLRLHSLRKQLLEQNAELEKWRRLHEEDLEAARLTQLAILPPRLPALDGWTFGAHYHPLMQIGGDIYDWAKAPDGSLLVWISDATGHGASAALLTTLSKLLFRHAAAECTGAADLMDRVEHEFQAIFKGHSFMTAACLVFSPGSSRVNFCGAGQPPLLIARRRGCVESIRSARPPLGLNKAESSVEETCELLAGESLLLYTDGLYEVQNSSGVRLGHEALIRLLPPPGTASAEAWLAAIVDQVKQYAGDVPYPDDIAAFAAVHIPG